MAPTFTTPNMGLVLPVVGQELGPQWATDLFTSLSTTLDQHNHTAGKGVQVPSAGININADLGFGSFNVTALRSSRYTNQGSPLALGPDVGCTYVSGGELWYNDTSARQVQLTKTGNANFSFLSYPERTPAISGNFTILSTDSFSLYYVDTSGGVATVNLPASSVLAVGRAYYFVDIKRNASTNNITVTPNGTDKINGVNANFVVSMNGSYTLLTTDGAGNWYANTLSAGFDGTFLGFLAGTQFLRVGPGGPGANFRTIWLGPGTGQGSAATDWTLSSQGTSLFINAPSGANIQFSIGAGNTLLQVDPSQTQQLGGQIAKQITQSSAYTVDSGATLHDYILLLTGNAFTVTLPAPTAGRVLIFVDAAGNANTQNKTIAPHAAETINGAASYVLNVNRASIALISDGTNWFVFGEYNGTVI